MQVSIQRRSTPDVSHAMGKPAPRATRMPCSQPSLPQQARLPRKFELDPVRDIQVPCPMNRSQTGARGLNQMLHEALNPPGEHSVERFGYRFSVADKVMQIENNYDKDVYNGDIGFVTQTSRSVGFFRCRLLPRKRTNMLAFFIECIAWVMARVTAARVCPRASGMGSPRLCDIDRSWPGGSVTFDASRLHETTK
jgi:hypothetical protein